MSNIGPRERRKRLVLGLVASGVSAILAAALLIGGAPRLMRVLLFFPLWAAGLGIFQARGRT